MLASYQRTSGSALPPYALRILGKAGARLHALAALIAVLNGVDAISTLLWVHLRYATEANPMMEPYVFHAPVTFVLSKVLLVSLSLVLLLRLSQRPLVPWALSAMAGLYVSVCVYHGLFAAQLTGWLA